MIKVGDLVIGYHKGIWRVLEITPRSKAVNGTDSPLVKYQKVADFNGKLTKAEIIHEVDYSFLKPLAEYIAELEHSLIMLKSLQ